MEDEEGDGEEISTPFWVKNNTDLRRGVSALFFSSGLVVLLLLVTAVSFLVFVVPKTLSLSAQIFRPNSVKKSWDSLNLVLVLVALLFGFISRNKNNDESPSSSSYYDEFQDSPMEQNQAQKHKTYQWPKSDLSTSKQWDGTYSEQQSSLMRRNISSYPDLRGFSSINWSNEDVERRYYDDIDTGRAFDQGKIHRRHRSLEQVDNLRTVSHDKTVVIDTLLSRYDTDVKAPAADRKSPPPHSASQLPELEKKEQLEYQSVAHKREKSSGKLKRSVEPMMTTVAPAMDAAALLTEEEKGSNSGRKRGGATKDFLNSLYHKKENKKQRQKSVEKLEIDSLVSNTEPPVSLDDPTPSPSPALKNIFSLKKHKRKKTITVSLKPSSATREAKPTSQSSRKTRSSAPAQVSSSASRKLPKNKMMNLLGNLDEISNSGGESPLNQIPPAPPPPPPGFLKSPSWKFVVRGDYVRVNSSASSRSDSPEIDDVEFAGDDTITPFGGSSPLFYQSPNVDIKAESFISSFRAKLKLEKMHSIKKREVGPSGLGPHAGPNQHQFELDE